MPTPSVQSIPSQERKRTRHPRPGGGWGERDSTHMNDRELVLASTAAFLGLAQVQREWPDILRAMGELDVDGYPTSSIGAGPPTPGPPVVYYGNCRDVIAGWAGTGPIMCNNPRPCPDHDTPVKLTPTEGAALALKPVSDRREAEIVVRRIAQDVKNLQRLTSPYRAKPVEPARCNAGMGREGNEEWANPPLPSLTLKCERWADAAYFGMCQECFDSMNVWRIAHELEPVERSPQVDYLAQRNVARGPKGRFTAA